MKQANMSIKQLKHWLKMKGIDHREENMSSHKLWTDEEGEIKAILIGYEDETGDWYLYIEE